MPSEIAKIVTQELTIPTIGIGAGPSCSGQVLVQLDMLAAYSAFTPKYLPRMSETELKICKIV